MSDDFQLRQDMDRAARAARLLEDELLTEAFDHLENEYFALWRDSKVSSTQDRENIWHAYKAIRAARTHLMRVVENGKLAAHELKQITT